MVVVVVLVAAVTLPRILCRLPPTQVTIPANHSSVALLKLAQLPYNGATSLFIRVLLNKKYALPYKVSSTAIGTINGPFHRSEICWFDTHVS